MFFSLVYKTLVISIIQMQPPQASHFFAPFENIEKCCQTLHCVLA